MNQIPTIETERLRLRPFTLDDGAEVQRLAGDWEIASTQPMIPHPYEDGVAEEWIRTHQEKFEKGEIVNFAVSHREQNILIGAISLTIHKEHEKAGLDYWIGKPYWNKGYATEAGRAVLKYGFDVLGLNRIYAYHLLRNPASGRVMQKIGMKYEGCLRQDYKMWGKLEDSVVYGMLREEYATASSESSGRFGLR